MLSNKAKYAFHALFALAEEGAPLMIAEIAQRKRLPRKFLEQILVDLKHHGLVASRRGKLGGYHLLKRPDEISLGEIVRIIDGPLAPLPCLSKRAHQPCEECISEETCALRRVFARAHAVSSKVLEQTTLADALSDTDAITA